MDVIRDRSAKGERVTANKRELLDGTPPQPPPLPGRRPQALTAAAAGGGLVLILGAALVLWGVTRDQPAASGDQAEPTATSTEPVDTRFTEVCYNGNGCRIFEDPYGSCELTRLEFMQEVEVSCRVFAPSLPSVEWWYRLASEPYNGEWWYLPQRDPRTGRTSAMSMRRCRSAEGTSPKPDGSRAAPRPTTTSAVCTTVP